MATQAIHQDNKKRTLEALERRFAVAKAELLQHQKKSKQVSGQEGEREDNSPKTSLPHVVDNPATLSSSTSLKKGSVFFTGYTSAQDIEENSLAYSQISQPVHQNLLATNTNMYCKGGNGVEKVLHDLLQHGDASQKYMQGSKTKKIDNWILLDNYVQGRSKRIRSEVKALKTHSKRSKQHMSMKQLKKCGLLDLQEDLYKYDAFKTMHEMWKSYITQLLKNTGGNQLAHCLLSADLHGAIILVADCKIASFTGVNGIMVRETRETFGIITRKDKFHVVPKKLSVFIFQVDCWKITLHGDKLTSRNLGI
ncbi:hypothetical protein K2173_019121 [Erythroxylum novogranatense]|uniref:Uncharacterized protein n=1 Tax=Erythroxylum novogranatense TaxID=1862640 RepID=A0AAV8SSW3_9ROSI|nr:hypothetical protein K2173_019121 [Erythroxylum novogranatense]